MQDQLFAYFIQQLLESIIDMTPVAESKGGAGVRPPSPPYFYSKLRPEGPKNFFWSPPRLIFRVWMTAAHLPPPPPTPYMKVWIRHWTRLPIRRVYVLVC